MNITRHYHVADVLQRSIVVHNGRLCRRIARWVKPCGELAPEVPETAIWQERQNNGDFHNVSDSLSKVFEDRFVTALIEANSQG